MRHTLCALVGVVLIASGSSSAIAAESGSSWWPFAKKDEAKAAAPPAVAPPVVGAPKVAAPVGSPFVAPHTAAAPTTVAPVPAKPAPAATADAAKEDKSWMLSTPKTKVGWPKLSMPKTAAKKPVAAEVPRNSWVDQTPITPKPSPFKPITDGAHKVSKGTKDAWHKTVDALTPGESTSSKEGTRIAKREIKPPFYKRMLGGKSEPQSPQTVPEWMAQQRLDP